MSLKTRALATLAAMMAAGTATAGPPYVTDDPEPTETGHWENYAFVSGTNTPGQTLGEAGFDINYGAAKDLQLTAIVPMDFDTGADGRLGAGDLQLAAKYRVLHQSGHGWTPDLSLFPQLGLPTGAPGLGTGHVSLFLPVWMQKDFGKWSTFGGGGYDINPGTGNRNFTLVGWAVTRDMTPRLNLGAEIYHQTPSLVGGRATTAVALGVIYRLSSHIALLASAGPGLQNSRQTGRSVFYTSVEFNY